MTDTPRNPDDQRDEPPREPPQRPRRRRRFRPVKTLKRLLLALLCLAIAFLAVRYGPNLYRRFFGDGNTTWISQRFGEELKEKNELVVYEATLTGEDTVTQDAWLLGTVQKVSIPYSFSMSFTVDLSLADVSVDTADDTVVVRLPSPKAAYYKLTVDEDAVQKVDWLYPLTTERYAEIKNEIEQKLYDECATKQEYLDAAWETAVKDMDDLFDSLSALSKDGTTCTIEVVKDDDLTAAETDDTANTETPNDDTKATATPEAA